MERIDRILGIIPLLGGIFGLLFAYHVIPVNRKDPEMEELWHKKFDKMMKILAPVLIVSGILQILGIL